MRKIYTNPQCIFCMAATYFSQHSPTHHLRLPQYIHWEHKMFEARYCFRFLRTTVFLGPFFFHNLSNYDLCLHFVLVNDLYIAHENV